MKVYAVQLLAAETISKVERMKQIMETTSAIGVNPDYPFAYVLWRTQEQMLLGFRLFERDFTHAKIVDNVAEI